MRRSLAPTRSLRVHWGRIRIPQRREILLAQEAEILFSRGEHERGGAEASSVLAAVLARSKEDAVIASLGVEVLMSENLLSFNPLLHASPLAP